MTDRPLDRQALVSGVVTLAESAGAAIMEVYRSGDVVVTDKADHSPLTQADLAAHRVIAEGLAKLAPGIPVLSEESSVAPFAERSGWARFWLVDPLDGTKEFIKRNGEFTVNIALIEEGTPVLGVVHAPALGVSYYAARGAGAFVQRGESVRPIRASRFPEGGGTIRVVASRSHRDARTEAVLARLGVHQCVSMGSSLKLCLVAEGEAHCYPRLGPTMEWDTAAAHAVVSQAGGTVCDLAGTELRYNKPDLHNPEFFVCHAEEKPRLAELVPQDASEAGQGHELKAAG